MKKIALQALGLSLLFFASCKTTQSSMSKNSTPFPGMTVSRSDYKLSKDETASIEIKEGSTLFGKIHWTKAVGEKKHVTRQGYVSGNGMDKASQIAVYKLLEANPSFDYLTNIRVTKEYTKKWMVLFTKYDTKVNITAKGITLNTEK